MSGGLTSPPQLWRSPDDLRSGDIEAALEAEFPSLHSLGGLSRRDLMRVMGASLALAGLSGCGRSSAPPLYSRASNPEDHAGERPLYFATSLELDGFGRGVLVKSFNGRPVKIEGNPLHPASLGATDPFMQAEVLTLYDADRSRRPFEAGRQRDWAGLRRWLIAQRIELAASGGQGTHVLLGPTSSPTIATLVARVRALYPAIRFHTYSAVTDPFDDAADQLIDFEQTEVILSLGADFLGAGPLQVRNAQHWIRRRRSSGLQLPKLFVAEGSPTLTGAQADRRFAIAPAAMEGFALAISDALTGGAGTGESAQVARGLSGGRALVVAGRDMPPAVRAIAAMLNQRLGNGEAVQPLARARLAEQERLEPLAPLAAEIAARRVRRLLILDCNPAYDVPGFAELLEQVPASLHLGLHRDETARLCQWHVPKRHVLESWGDLRAFDGTVGIQQPATVPLVSALSPIEMLALLAGERADGRALVRAQWSGLDEAVWSEALEAGVVPDTAAPSTAAASAPAVPVLRTNADPGEIELLFQPDSRLWDGRFANNAWLQELPHPLSKLVWGNAAFISPELAAIMELENGDKIAIQRGNAAAEAGAWILPGQARNVVTLTLGYGRPFAGRVGAELGYNAYPLRAARGPVRLTKLSGKQRLISTQQHQPLGPGSPVRLGEAEATAAVETNGFYPEFPSVEHAWAMVIDLDACIGCGTCTIACQAENNIPVVGPDEVEKGREMHWIRVDRYYSGEEQDPDTFFQPVPCMHCEKAPCELVCPVGATLHSSEGLNQMVYNRCVGTRTCSNNCPYKVRRFNWFDYTERETAPDRNPRVTVRERGVMEKCTYCVQRINDARSDARVENRPIGDELQTACQQACPTDAIIFGDLADPNSAVSRLKRSGRNYALLGELNTQPRTSYLARVKRDRG